jgi:hypothetical protein
MNHLTIFSMRTHECWDWLLQNARAKPVTIGTECLDQRPPRCSCRRLRSAKSIAIQRANLLRCMSRSLALLRSPGMSASGAAIGVKPTR